MRTEYVVMTSSAKGPNVRGIGRLAGYRNVALVEVEAGVIPSMISERARGLVRIVRHSGALNVGSTPRSAYRQTLARYEAEAAALNAARA